MRKNGSSTFGLRSKRDHKLVPKWQLINLSNDRASNLKDSFLWGEGRRTRRRTWTKTIYRRSSYKDERSKIKRSQNSPCGYGCGYQGVFITITMYTQINSNKDLGFITEHEVRWSQPNPNWNEAPEFSRR